MMMTTRTMMSKRRPAIVTNGAASSSFSRLRLHEPPAEIMNLKKLAKAQEAADASIDAAMLAAEKVAELAEPKRDRAVAFSTRLRVSTIAAIDARAQADGTTLKQVICRGLAELGVAVAPADLKGGTPRRRRTA
jgi:hypothetical protein